MPTPTTIAGHVAEEGSEAHRHLRNAAGNEEMAKWASRNAPDSYDRYVLATASDIECAINSAGYIGPAPRKESE